VKTWAQHLRREALVVWLAARDPRVPITAKALALLVAAYAFSPIDLVPDFVPVLGLLDDLVLVPAGVWLVIHLIPKPVVAELRAEAARLAVRPVSRAGIAVVLVLWAFAAGLVLAWLL
jgi:uncharacterized membrane protein YkvA (DUF1232 family)